ncbi:LytTR family transcriptional regulator [Lacihabitans sp. CCS-44]|uniref:LytTR family DNA-binding domain-containing protein n=1 Tax=Lacihabitans sp. CCS-44 TaxID=2487331 RepID=UPI0020CBBE8C|nr:LytTR family DNA-binding domain-containing protein [Lacihabitans sp. CCS-44]MCP9753956.1 LytTR family transcriptional regulator [Lacihabitans sp. CCS-44]
MSRYIKLFEANYLDKIVYLEAVSNYTKLHLSSGEKLVIPKTLKFFESLLVGKFTRIHRKFLSNNKVEWKVSDTFLIYDGYRLPFSRRKRSLVLRMVRNIKLIANINLYNIRRKKGTDITNVNYYYKPNG